MITTSENIKKINDVDGLPTFEIFVPSTADGIIKEREVYRDVRYDARICVGYQMKYNGEIIWHKDVAELPDAPISRKQVNKYKTFKTYEQAEKFIQECKKEFKLGAEYRTLCFGYRSSNFCEALQDFYSGPQKCKDCPFFKTKMQAEFERNKAELRAKKKKLDNISINVTEVDPGFLISAK